MALPDCHEPVPQLAEESGSTAPQRGTVVGTANWLSTSRRQPFASGSRRYVESESRIDLTEKDVLKARRAMGRDSKLPDAASTETSAPRTLSEKDGMNHSTRRLIRPSAALPWAGRRTSGSQR